MPDSLCFLTIPNIVLKLTLTFKVRNSTIAYGYPYCDSWYITVEYDLYVFWLVDAGSLKSINRATHHVNVAWHTWQDIRVTCYILKGGGYSANVLGSVISPGFRNDGNTNYLMNFAFAFDRYRRSLAAVVYAKYERHPSDFNCSSAKHNWYVTENLINLALVTLNQEWCKVQRNRQLWKFPL